MRPTLALLAAVALSLLSGCASINQRQVVVGLDQELSRSSSRPTIQVDVVGLTDAERKQWDAQPLSSYWMPHSDSRAAIQERSVQIRFSPERSELFVIPTDSEIWDRWRKAGAKWLYVVANLPGGMSDRAGADDPRRLAISLGSSEWADDAPLEIQIRRDAVVFTTPPRTSSPAKTP